jgi:hypothetical protein
VWCLEALKLEIPSVSLTTSIGILHMLDVLCCISSGNIANVVLFACLFLVSFSFHKVVYCDARNFPLFSRKALNLGSCYPTNATNINNQE